MRKSNRIFSMKAGLLAAGLLAAPGFLLGTPAQPKHVIGLKKAELTALKKAPGKVTDSELEFEKKQWVYSFDIKGNDKKIHEVLVNARSGKIVSSTIESPAKEAKEMRDEHPSVTPVETPKK